MAITLAAVPDGSFWMQALVLAVVGIGITIAVYGVVALTTLAWLLPNTMEVQLSAG